MSSGIASYPSAPVKRLVDEGVVVCAGTDGVRDTFGPYDNGDMLERAMLVGLRNNFYRDQDLELALDICTHGGAKTLALEGYGLTPGCRADFVLFEAENRRAGSRQQAAKPSRLQGRTDGGWRRRSSR